MKIWHAILPILLPLAALAETATVRSGNHADFSRLTVTMPEGADWSLSEAPGMVRVTFTAPIDAVDVSQVFNRIARDRIADVTAPGGRALAIQLTCRCASSAIKAGNLLIIDIRNGPPLTEADRPTLAAETADLPQLIQSQTRLSFGTPRAPATMQSPTGDHSMPAQAKQHVPQAATREISRTNSAFAARVVNSLPDLPAPQEPLPNLTRALENNLLQAIGRAATEGVLDPAGPLDVALAEELRHVNLDPGTGGHASPGIQATPQTIEAATGDPGRFMLSGDPCALHMKPSVAEEPAQDFATELGALRMALTGEFDRDNGSAYGDLAQFYLLNGFGAEAARMLDSVPQDPERATEMQAAAQVLEYGYAPERSAFSGKLECDSEAAMWAALTGETLDTSRPFNGAAILRSIMTLPTPLKSYLGPLLADRFIVAKETDFAKDILRIVDRDVAEPTSMRDLATAKIDTHETGAPDHDSFQALIGQNDDVSPEALLHYANETLDQGDQVNPETIGLLESYRAQYRDAPLSAKLVRTEIIAHASMGNFPAAYDLFAEQNDLLDERTRAFVADGLTRNLASNAADAVFTRQFFRHEPIIRAGASAETMNIVAGRLLALGFVNEADRLLAAGAEGDAGRQRRILRARVALSNNLPRRAEAELFGMSGPDVDLLLGQARMNSDQFTEAQTLFDNAGATEAAASAAWLARDWNTMNSGDATPKARMAEVVTDQQAAPVILPAVGPPTLAASRDILNQSNATRAALNELLSSVQVDTALDQ